MDDAYRTEKNVDVRERFLLVRRVLVDNEQKSRVADKEFHRSRWWAYKWLKRLDDIPAAAPCVALPPNSMDTNMTIVKKTDFSKFQAPKQKIQINVVDVVERNVMKTASLPIHSIIYADIVIIIIAKNFVVLRHTILYEAGQNQR